MEVSKFPGSQELMLQGDVRYRALGVRFLGESSA